MQFTMENLDMDCGLSKPLIVALVALQAVLLGASVAWVVLGRRTLVLKGLFLAIAAGLSLVLVEATPLLLASWVQYIKGRPGLEVGCMGSPPALLGPVATGLFALLFLGTGAAWRRVRAPRSV